MIDTQEMQRLEQRIREAARDAAMLSSSSSGGSGSSIDLTTSSSSSSSSLLLNTSQESLYQERLKEYQELAARYDSDGSFRDTVAMAERNGGVIEGRYIVIVIVIIIIVIVIKFTPSSSSLAHYTPTFSTSSSTLLRIII